MGEIADDHYDQMVDEGGYFWHYRPKRKPTCHACGKTGLNWQKVKGSKWRLHDGKVPHVCATSADGFEDVPDEQPNEKTT